MKNADKNLYSTLGVMPEATQAQIRAAYRVAAMKNHPDRFISYAQILWATRQMQDINHAYSVLRDPTQRQTYDEAHPSSPVWDKKRTTQESPPLTPERSSKERTIFNVVGYTVWILASAVFSYLYATDGNPEWAGRWIFFFFLGLCLTPLILLTIISVIVIPVATMAVWFNSSYSAKKHELAFTERAHVWRDFFIRLIMLGAVVSCIVLSFNWGINSDILYLILTAWTCGILGELAAMLLWITRVRKVVAETFALLKIDG